MDRKGKFMKICFSPYKKYVLLALLTPLLMLIIFLNMNQLENSKLLFPLMLFAVLFLFPLFMVLPNLIVCPKCEQKIGCGKENCMDWHGLNRFRAIFTTKCKKCGFNLNEIKEEDK
jgi:hypothetical protein